MLALPIEFQSESVTLRGRLHLPRGEGPFPVVAMTNGFTATIEMSINRYAEYFAEHGVAALMWDHAGFGISDGDPRYALNPWLQARGYLDAFSFIEEDPRLDAERIAAWGDSMSAGVATVVTACDSRVRALVAQVPACGRSAPPPDPDGKRFAQLRETLLNGNIQGTADTSRGPLPVVSYDPIGTPALLEPLTAFRWFMEHGARYQSGWVNHATRVLPPTPEPYHVALATPFVRVPAMAMISPRDEMPGANSEVAHAAFAACTGPTEIVDIEGGHFGIMFDPSPELERARATQMAFLKRWL